MLPAQMQSVQAAPTPMLRVCYDNERIKRAGYGEVTSQFLSIFQVANRCLKCLSGCQQAIQKP